MLENIYLYIRNSYNVSYKVNSCIFKYDVILEEHLKTDFPQSTDEKHNKNIGKSITLLFSQIRTRNITEMQLFSTMQKVSKCKK